jgi:hypothetical protein
MKGILAKILTLSVVFRHLILDHSFHGKTIYEDVPKRFWTESIIKYRITTINTWEATQRVMVAKLNRLTHKIAIQMHLVAERYTICSSGSSQPVWKLLDTPSYDHIHKNCFWSLHPFAQQICLFLSGLMT